MYSPKGKSAPHPQLPSGSTVQNCALLIPTGGVLVSIILVHGQMSDRNFFVRLLAGKERLLVELEG